MPHSYFVFGDFTFDTRRRRLTHRSDPIAMTPKTQELLLVFLESPNRLVTKDELARRVWPNSDLSDANISQHVAMLRKALRDPSSARSPIVTKYGQGFELALNVRSVDYELGSVTDDAPVASPELASACSVLSRIAESLGICAMSSAAPNADE
jgi:DNA-binding winged helix-turn-helix (wHTH) protein